MWLEIRREPDNESASEGVGGVAPAADDSFPDGELVEQSEFVEGANEATSSISLSPGWLLGIFTVAVGCAVLSIAGLWLAGQIGGVGPLAGWSPLQSGSSGGRGVSPGQASVVAVAVVNGEPVTAQQLDDLVAINMAMAALESGQLVTLTPEQWQRARSQLLNQVIRNTLIIQAARSAGITVSDAQAEAEWLAWVRKYELTPDQLEAQLTQAGANPDVLREWLRNALIANVYLSQFVDPGATPEERKQVIEQWIEQQMAIAQIQIYQPAAN